MDEGKARVEPSLELEGILKYVRRLGWKLSERNHKENQLKINYPRKNQGILFCIISENEDHYAVKSFTEGKAAIIENNASFTNCTEYIPKKLIKPFFKVATENWKNWSHKRYEESMELFSSESFF